MPAVGNNPLVENTNEARTAATGHDAHYVLLISTLAAILLFAVAHLVTKS